MTGRRRCASGRRIRCLKRIGEHIGVDMADLFWNGKSDAIIAEITRLSRTAAKLPACPVSRDVLEIGRRARTRKDRGDAGAVGA